jgi:KaiC/GvpD/RAD55 family RecA-like ATPase
VNVLPRTALIENLTKGPVPPGYNILVEYDPASLWYSVVLTITAGWIKSGGVASCTICGQPPVSVRSNLKRLGLNVEELERNDRLRIWDWYTCTLGRKSKERLSVDSLKVADMSIEMRSSMEGPPRPEYLRIMDNFSNMARFNDEKAWVEYALTRGFPSSPMTQSTTIEGIISNLHSNWVYRNFEAAVDGIIDVKLDEASNPARNLIRIRSMRGLDYDGHWHALRVGDNFEVTLEE